LKNVVIFEEFARFLKNMKIFEEYMKSMKILEKIQVIVFEILEDI
jgi:hypothetical protein